MRPPPRSGLPRLPATAGGDLGQRGWREDGGLWFAEGLGEAWRAPLAPGTAARAGRVLRTDHVALRTNARADPAVEVARAAEAHVRGLFARHGDDLDLVFPAAPLVVVLTAGRAEFERELLGVVREPRRWGAFYDAPRGAVFVCLEPTSDGPLPLLADLRHEMTHQVLDLSTPARGRAALLGPPLHWLWEGFAVAQESGEGDTGAVERAGRLALPRARGEVTPHTTLFALDQAGFEGRHYDQAGSLMGFLLRDGVTGSRRAVLAILAEALHGVSSTRGMEARLGLSPEALEARWLASLP